MVREHSLRCIISNGGLGIRCVEAAAFTIEDHILTKLRSRVSATLFTQVQIEIRRSASGLLQAVTTRESGLISDKLGRMKLSASYCSTPAVSKFHRHLVT